MTDANSNTLFDISLYLSSDHAENLPTDEQTKICSYCHAVKPLSEFNSNKNASDNLTSACRACRKVSSRKVSEKYSAYWSTHDPNIEQPDGKLTKICTKCNEEKHLTDFQNAKNVPDGKSSTCRLCCQKHAKAYDQQCKDFWATHDAYDVKDSPFTSGEKACTACKILLPLTQFYKTPSTKEGLTTQCRKCLLMNDKIRKYGRCIEPDDRCAICEAKEDLCVDHCHVSGKTRDILCSPCNIMLGLARDNIAILLRAAQYLEQHTVIASRA
jgi:hypothetical protein